MKLLHPTHLTATAIALGVMMTAPLRGSLEGQTSRRDSLFRLLTDYPSYVKGGSVQPRWMADGDRFWYADSMPNRTVIWQVDPRRNTVEPLFDSRRLRLALSQALGHQPPYEGLPFSSFTFRGDENTVRFSLEGRDWLLNRESYALTSVPNLTPEERERRVPQLIRRMFPVTQDDLYEVASPDQLWFLTERQGNLWLRAPADGRLVQLTRDGIEGVEWSTSGALWSPNSFKVLALKSDVRHVHKVPVLHWLKREEQVEWITLPKVGGAMRRVEAYIVDVLSKQPTRIEIQDSGDFFLSPIRWLPDGSEVLLYKMSRDMKQLQVLAANGKTGAVRVVLTEAQPTFIKGIATNPGWRDLLTLLDDGKRFLWISERDGWDHLYLYAIDGTLIRRLTAGTFPVLRVIDVDTKGGWVYFTAHAEPRVYDTHLYRVGLDGRGFTRLTEGTGTHTTVVSPSKQYFLDTHSDVDRPPTVEVRGADGQLVRVLSRATIDGLRALGWRNPEMFTVKAADGQTELHGALYKPIDFDPSRKYPVIEYIYGGPQVVNVPHAFVWGRLGGMVREQALAQLGFIVFVLDARGTPERGKAFQDVVYRSFGRNEIPDHVAALKELGARHPYMDLGRVGIIGGSWGGYMALRALVLAPESYHVGIATLMVADLYDLGVGGLEGYMDLMERNPEGYEYGSSLRLIGNLKGKLLIINGTSDVNATFSASMRLVDAMTRAGKEYDLKVVPELNHALAPIKEYFLKTIREYFVRNLHPE